MPQLDLFLYFTFLSPPSSSSLPSRSVSSSSGSSVPLQLGLPVAVPPQYNGLKEVSIEAVRARLRLLYHFSDLMYSSWRLLNLSPNNQVTTKLPFLKLPVAVKAASHLVLQYVMMVNVILTLQSCTSHYNAGTWGIVQGQLRPLLAPRVYTLPMVRSIGKTMVQGKNYGPQITVKRISTRSVLHWTHINTHTVQKFTNLAPIHMVEYARWWLSIHVAAKY